MRGAGGFFAALPSCPPPRAAETAPAGRAAIRSAREADLAQIAAIWNHEVLCTDATTDTEPRDPIAQRE
jgi:L-amino acid N-acyltransferase